MGIGPRQRSARKIILAEMDRSRYISRREQALLRGDLDARELSDASRPPARTLFFAAFLRWLQTTSLFREYCENTNR
jgi:hypothetical protein